MPLRRIDLANAAAVAALPDLWPDFGMLAKLVVKFGPDAAIVSDIFVWTNGCADEASMELETLIKKRAGELFFVAYPPGRSTAAIHVQSLDVFRQVNS